MDTLFRYIQKAFVRRGMQSLSVSSRMREELVDITDQVQRAVADSGCDSGLCILYNPHTTAAVTVNEGADPSVARDIVRGLADLVPESRKFEHAEGNSDAHIKTSLTGPSLTLLIDKGQLVLGTWQRLFFCEYDGPRSRELYVKIMPDRTDYK
jgi:secondary thiamine-phosphate synthase enzyme